MTVALEPMANAGRPDTRVLKDRWTVVTADGALCAHFEHSICIAEEAGQAEILTELPERVYRRIGVARARPGRLAPCPAPAPAMAEAPPPDLVEYVGLVSRSLANDLFEVRLADGRLVLAHLAPGGPPHRPPRRRRRPGQGRPGAYDHTRGRITGRPRAAAGPVSRERDQR